MLRPAVGIGAQTTSRATPQTTTGAAAATTVWFPTGIKPHAALRIGSGFAVQTDPPVTILAGLRNDLQVTPAVAL